MRNILFITTQFPYPLDNGGKIGAFNGLSVISQNNKVYVLSFFEGDEKTIEEGVSYYREKLPNVEFYPPIIHDIHIRKKPIKLCWAILKGILSNSPYATTKFESQYMYKLVDEIIQDKYWDYLFVDYINVTQYALYIKRKYRKQYGKMIFKDHNIEFQLIDQEAEKYHGVKKHVLLADSKRTYNREVLMCRESQIVFTVCDDNKDFLSKHNSNTYTMSPTYDIPKQKKIVSRPRKNNILYIGGLAWQPNLSGLTWFVDKVFPLIKNKIPEAHLTIVGSGSDGTLFEKVKDVEYKGYVKNLENEYKNGDVFIVPLFEASGIRIKILEAFANDIPVVSTGIGCKTIGAKPGEDIFVANDEFTFADAVCDLLDNDALNRTIATNAYDFLCEKYSLKHRSEEFERIVKKTDE